MKKEDVIKATNSNLNGLNDEQITLNKQKFGTNKLKDADKKSFISKTIEQLKSPLIIILLIATVVSLYLSEIKDAIIILMVVFFNAIIGVTQENKAEKAIEELKKMSQPYIKVKRNNKYISIKTEDLAVGDIVIVEAGDFIPADMRIIKSASLKVEEASLTGESAPVEKSDTILEDEKLILSDRINMAYSGSIVVYGRAEGVIVAVGMNTEVGKIANTLINTKEVKTPLQKRITKVTNIIVIGIIMLSILTYFLGMFRGFSSEDMFFISVSLAVAAIPEGMPAVITIILAIGVRKLAVKNAIIRKLVATETLGGVQIICSDKTGTLTQNKMTVVNVFSNNILTDLRKEKLDVNNNKYLLENMLLCNDSKIIEENGNLKLKGDPTETALIDIASSYIDNKLEFDIEHERLFEIPFDSDRKLMTTINKYDSGNICHVKGAPEILLKVCTHILVDKKIIPLTEEILSKLEKEQISMSKKALRVLGAAYKKIDEIPHQKSHLEIESNLVFIGFVGMIDPPREEVKESIKKCFNAGIIPVMITGDNKETAIAIAKELGILENNSQAITGDKLDKLSDKDFSQQVLKYRVYARVTPHHKVKIVKAWKHHRKVVAMTGDGVNDAPALKSADIGIGMGITGTEVSKSVSSMVLADDNFSTIVYAIEEGRSIFNNMKKALYYMVSSNLAEVVVIMGATILGVTILKPIQILWINLVTGTIPALGLAVEKQKKDLMLDPPKKINEGFFTKTLSKNIVMWGIINGLLVLLVYYVAILFYKNEEVAITMAFLSLVTKEMLFSFICKDDENSILGKQFFDNKFLILATFGTIIIQYIMLYIKPVRELFYLVLLTPAQYMIIIGISLSIFIIDDVIKGIKKLFVKNKLKNKKTINKKQ
jgi:Ca2+-transporting ATPase